LVAETENLTPPVTKFATGHDVQPVFSNSNTHMTIQLIILPSRVRFSKRSFTKICPNKHL
jgi:hypothetical protein